MRLLFLILVLSCALASSTLAQTTQATGAALEHQQLTSAPGLKFSPTDRATSSSDLLSTSQLFVGLFIVLSLIFGAKWLVPQIWPAVAAQRNGAVRVLGRTPISPKNQIVLVQVGQRVLVLGENAGSLSTLSTIDDSNEVAVLVGKASARVERISDTETPFSSALAQSNRAYETAEPPTSNVEPVTDQKTAGELTDLISKVRGLARQLGRS